MNNPEWTPGVAQLACKCFHSTKNCLAIAFAGLTPSNHIKDKSASTSYEINFTRFILLCIVAPMIEGGPFVLLLLVLIFIFMLSDRSKAKFPADPQSKRAQQQKALTGGPSFDQDEVWGQWKPSDSTSSKDAIISNPVTVKQEDTEPGKPSST